MEITQHPGARYFLFGIGWAVNCRTRRAAEVLVRLYGWRVYKYKGLPGFFVQDGKANQGIA